MKKTLLGICGLGLALSLVACGDDVNFKDPASVQKFLAKSDPQAVRKALENKHIALNANNFINYAFNSDTLMMTVFLKAAFEIDAAADNGNNAVAIAANKGNVMVLNYLFDHGAKANVKNSLGEPVLDNAVMMGNTDVVKILIDQLKKEGADPASLGTGVLIAAKTGKVDMLQVLADAGAPLDNRGPDGYLPIHWTVKSGNYDAMMFLIEKGVDVNAKCGQGYSVLDWATNEGYTRLIKALKKAGAKNTPQYFKDSKK
jgi:ankyrin repeat protein